VVVRGERRMVVAVDVVFAEVFARWLGEFLG
jgi:hypothetical protein